MSLSKKHYEALAGILKAHKAEYELVKSFVEMLKDDNPRFKENKFYEASGVIIE